MKKLLILLIPLIFFSECTKSHFQKADILVTGTAEPAISLNGAWKFTMDPPENFFMNEVSFAGWNDILVPVDSSMKGYIIKPDTKFVYKTLVAIPSDYKGKVIKLRFERVDGSVRVWVNGTFICSHSTGLAGLDCDITKNVEPGTTAWLTLEVTGMDREVTVPDGNAKQQFGDITGGVSLLALPDNYPSAIIVQTKFDSKNKDAYMNIKVVPSSKDKTWVGFILYDPEGKLIRLNDKRYLIKGDTLRISFPVKTPAKSDAAHPNLYALITEVFNRSILTSSDKKIISFREVEIKRR